MDKKGKVICIGWHKTGTTTLGDALLVLGYHVVGARLDLSKKLLAGETDEAIKLAADFNALQDVPWNALYKELDQAYPGSKFILTTRDEKKWLNSAKKHFGSTYIRMHEYLYGEGVLDGNEQLYLDRFNRHYNEVHKYFKGRESDILAINLAENDGWDAICSFLGEPVPSKSFPHSNKGKHNYTATDKLVEGLKNMIPLSIRHMRMKMLSTLGRPDPRDRFNNRKENEVERLK